VTQALPSRDIFTVSRLNLEVRAALEGSFPLLWISGEISNLATPRSGHLYFTLKDSAAQVRCAMFRARRNLARIQPTDGMQVIVRARVTLYEPRGDYQLVIEQIEEAGEGLLRQQVERLKRSLEAEGLFSSDHKLRIPGFPRRIGVVTSPTGAAVRDVLSVLRRRCAAIPVLLYPVAVQGATAAAEIVEMLRIVQQRRECDLLILTRGGGSLEDMMAFNDEALVREIYRLEIPLISAIGHEIDTCLTDFVADQRAPTPSAAAEIAAPDCEELGSSIGSLFAALLRSQQRRLLQLSQRLDELCIRLNQQHPGNRLQVRQRQLDSQRQRLLHSMRHSMELLQRSHVSLRHRLERSSPRQLLLLQRQRLDNLAMRLARRMREQLHASLQRLAGVSRELNAVSPLATLERGYSITFDSNMAVLTDASRVRPDDHLRVRLAKGELACRVEKVVE
jgi:exodeoxyribonuclease VII large subunit